ncbi:MAG: RusA family crossover junction endodeoxyribonuclease [Candidatus Dormiibacterota bacterium]
MARPRVAVRGGKAHGYVPARTQQAAWEIRQCAMAALGAGPPFEGAVRLSVAAYLPVPKSLPKRSWGKALPTKRPDVDNFAKTALDGLSPLWGDDSQVVELSACKQYAWQGSPRWEIALEEIR